MKKIIVATGKNAPNGYGVQKYSNNEGWNTLNGSAPNGVNATRWLRKTQPNPEKLSSSLARWLVEHAPTCVAGKMPSFNKADDVYCFNGKTEGDMRRENWREFYGNRIYGLDNTEEKAKQIAENFCKVYGLDNIPCKINWLFGHIRFEESDEQYWERQAAAMLAAGTVKIVIGDAVWVKSE